MTGFYCPVEGCEKHDDEWDGEQPPLDTIASVRAHVNATSDDAHDRAGRNGSWADAPEFTSDDSAEQEEGAREELKQEEKADEEATDEADTASSTDSEEADTASSSEPSEEDTEADSEEMVSQAEYQRQTEGGQDDQTDQQNNPKASSSGGSSNGLLPNIPPMWTVAIIAGIFALIVILRIMASRSSEPEMTSENDDSSNSNEVPLLED